MLKRIIYHLTNILYKILCYCFKIHTYRLLVSTGKEEVYYCRGCGKQKSVKLNKVKDVFNNEQY